MYSISLFRYDCLSIVDTVASLGGVPFNADDLGIDVVYAGSQKALSAPPGAAPITFNARAKEAVLNRKTKPISYLFDMQELANYWGCDEGPRRYFVVQIPHDLDFNKPRLTFLGNTHPASQG